MLDTSNTLHNGLAPAADFQENYNSGHKSRGWAYHPFLGGVDVTICLGNETVTQHCRVFDTDAFDIVIGTDCLRRNPQVKMLSLQRPYSLHCNFGSGLFSVPLELSGQKESVLRYAAKTNYRTQN